MRNRTWLSGVAATLVGLLGGCSPEGAANDPLSQAGGAPPKISQQQQAITTAAAKEATERAFTYILPDTNAWINNNITSSEPAWEDNQCTGCHRIGAPVLGASVAKASGYNIPDPAATGFSRVARFINARVRPDGSLGYSGENHAHTATAYDSSGLLAFTALSGNTQYVSNSRLAMLRLINTKDSRVSVQAPTSAPPYWPGNVTYRNNFPADGQIHSGKVTWFVANDHQSCPIDCSWQQMTGMVVQSLSYLLNVDATLAGAAGNTYRDYMNSLADTLEGVWQRQQNWGTQATAYGLFAMIATGRTPDVNARAAAMRDRLLTLYAVSGATKGWGDTPSGFGINAMHTGQALYALCRAGVRFDVNPNVRDALLWLASAQVKPDGTRGYWTMSGLSSVDVPTTFAALGLACYGVISANVNTSIADATVNPNWPNVQTVNYTLTVQNTGYANGSFNIAVAGAPGGATLSQSTLNLAGGESGTVNVSINIPVGQPSGVVYPISHTVSFAGPNGLVSTNKNININVGQPVAGPASTITFTAGAGATVTAGQNLTLRARAANGATTLTGGSMTFLAGATAIGTVSYNAGAGAFEIVWPVSGNLQGNQTVTANYTGWINGAVTYGPGSVQTVVNVLPLPAPSTPTLTQAPSNGSVLVQGGSSVSIGGNTQAGAVVTISSGANQLGSTTANGSGVFVTNVTLPPGQHVITVTATNSGGTSAPTSGITVTVNPVPPTLGSHAANGTVVTGTTGHTITGTANPGATVTIRNNGNVLTTVTADANGAFSANISLPQGVNTLTVAQTQSGATSAATTTNINVVPPTPTLGTPANNAALPNGNNSFTGTAVAGTTVTILANGVAVGSGVANAMGQFNITAPLPFGQHSITVTASNGAGPSAPSAAITVRVAPGAPVITTPAAANTDLIGAITFAGTGVAGATVTLFDNGVQVGQQVAAANGSFSFTIAAPTLGAHSLTATQTINGQTSPASAARVVTVRADADGDLVYDDIDNCPNAWNKDQVDRDADGLGDVCDQAPAQKDSTNQTTSSTDIAITTFGDAGADDNLLARNQNNLVLLPAGAWAQRNTLTLVADRAANPTGNIQLFGKASPTAPAWQLMGAYDLQLGPTHPVTLADGRLAQVSVVTERTTLASNAFRTRQVQVRVREADGSTTTIPSCSSGMTASANDPRCVSASVAYQNVEGTNVNIGIKLSFDMKSL